MLVLYGKDACGCVAGSDLVDLFFIELLSQLILFMLNVCALINTNTYFPLHDFPQSMSKRDRILYQMEIRQVSQYMRTNTHNMHCINHSQVKLSAVIRYQTCKIFCNWKFKSIHPVLRPHTSDVCTMTLVAKAVFVVRIGIPKF